MATFIFLDSNHRVGGVPTDYIVNVSQTNNWSQFSRLGTDTSTCLLNAPGSSCLVNVTIKSLVIFYDTITPSALIKIHFNNLETKDINLINTITPNKNFNFVLDLWPQIPAGPYTINPTGWVRYNCQMTQRMRMKRNGAFLFTVYDGDDNVLDVGTNGRVFATFSLE
jgi:hypothetical protein